MEIKSSPPFSYKTVLLSVLSIVLLAFFFNIEIYKLWFDARILTYWEDFGTQRDELDVEKRKQDRFGSTYVVCNMIKENIKKDSVKDPVILFEPNGYYEQKGIPFKAPEPAVFYYFTGLKSVWTNSKDVRTATHIVYLTNEGLRMEKVDSPAVLNRFLSEYQKYPAGL